MSAFHLSCKVKLFSCILIGLMAFSFFSCPKPVGSSSSSVTSVTVNPGTATVEKGGTQYFTAYVDGTNNPSQAVSWSIVETNKNTFTTIDGAGKLVISPDESLETLTVIATSSADGSKRGTAFVTVSDDYVYTGPTTVTVTFNSNGGSLVDSQTIEIGTMADEPPVPTRADHSFGGWFIDTAFNVLFNFYSPVNSDITIYAKWLDYVPPSDDPDLTYYTVTFNTNGGSTVTSQTVASGALISSPVPPSKAEATFNGWFSDSSLTVPYNFYSPVNSDMTLYAKWLGSYTVTFNSNGGSTVASITAVGGAAISQPAPPTRSAYNFGGWYTDNNTFANAYNFSTAVNSSFTLYAKWVIADPTDAASITAYLNSASGGNSVSNPVQLKITGNQIDWMGLISILDTANKYVALDLSESSGMGTFVINGNVTSTSIGRSRIVSIILPDTTPSISYGAFGNSKITSITIPSGVTSIGMYAFYECPNLASVTIPNSVTSISYGAFFECRSLASVIIPNGVTSIEDSVFSGCDSLANVTIPNSVTSIGQQAFFRCSSLTSVTIPNSVTSIGYGAFVHCGGLTSINIPNSVTSIEVQTFAACGKLSSITIPSSITSIGAYAFFECFSLTRVTFQGNLSESNFAIDSQFPGDLRDKYLAEGAGTYTRPNVTATTWTKQ